MRNILTNKKTSFLLGIVLIITLGLIVSLSLTRQNIRNQASAIPSLYFSPSSTTSTPLIHDYNAYFNVDLMVDPADAIASFVTFAIEYDSSILTVENTSDISINTTAFPIVFEGPYLNPGRVEGTVSIGSDPTKGIVTPTRVATIRFKTIGHTGNSTTAINHKNTSMILSVGANEGASQNVLGLTVPAIIKINEPASPTPSMTPAPTSTPTPANIKLNLTVFLHGIGQSGDNRNPSSTLSNKNPQRPERNTFVEIYDSLNRLTASKEAVIKYASESGNFQGVVELGNIANGGYTVKVKTEQHLRYLVPGIQNISSSDLINIPNITLVTGDTNNDNRLDILDYNILYGCYTSDLMPTPRSCPGTNSTKADLDDEGKVNLFDLNLFIRELSVQSGI